MSFFIAINLCSILESRVTYEKKVLKNLKTGGHETKTVTFETEDSTTENSFLFPALQLTGHYLSNITVPSKIFSLQ